MQKRIIKITAIYDLEDSCLLGLEITPKETVKNMVEEEMQDYFGKDEGYLGVEVEVIDE